jgi:hypothetical protein
MKRSAVIRVVASSLCFDQDPPPVRSLDKARIAAAAIVDALADADMVTVEDDRNTNGGSQPGPADDDATPLFPVAGTGS